MGTRTLAQSAEPSHADVTFWRTIESLSSMTRASITLAATAAGGQPNAATLRQYLQNVGGASALIETERGREVRFFPGMTGVASVAPRKQK